MNLQQNSVESELDLIQIKTFSLTEPTCLTAQIAIITPSFASM